MKNIRRTSTLVVALIVVAMVGLLVTPRTAAASPATTVPMPPTNGHGPSHLVTDTTSPTLAMTGGHVSTVVLAALGLMAVGGLVLVGLRRRASLGQ